MLSFTNLLVLTKILVNFIISIDEFFILTFDSAISSLKQGEFVMIHDSDAVSYTLLRAHETRHDLV